MVDILVAETARIIDQLWRISPALVYLPVFLFLMLPEIALFSLGILIPLLRQFLPEKSVMNVLFRGSDNMWFR